MKFPRKISFEFAEKSHDSRRMEELNIVHLGVYFVVVNAVTWIAFWLDKRSAISGSRRIPEKTLLSLTALGGILGAFHARHTLRHKTRKQPFSMYLYAIAACQVVVLIAVLAGENLIQYLG